MTQNRLFNFFKKHFDIQTPYELLGVAPNATDNDVRKAFFGKMEKLSAEGGKALGASEALLKNARDILFNPELRKNLDKWITATSQQVGEAAPTAKVYVLPMTKQAQERLDAVKKFPISKPLVAMGGAVLAIGSAIIGIKATEDIRNKKDAGENPTLSDRAQQALGFAGAAGVISAAVLMWKSGKGRG